MYCSYPFSCWFLLCDLMGRATLNVTMMLFVPKMVRKHPLTRPCIHSLVSAQATKKFLVPMRHTIQGNTFYILVERFKALYISPKIYCNSSLIGWAIVQKCNSPSLKTDCQQCINIIAHWLVSNLYQQFVVNYLMYTVKLYTINTINLPIPTCSYLL